MKIAIISDIHDNLVNLNKFFGWINKEKICQIICCGDVTNDETLSVLAKQAAQKIYLVKGNIELYSDQKIKDYQNIDFFGRLGYIEINGKKIGFCHEPYLIGKVLEKGTCDIIFYGHTHKPWESEQAGTKTVNPGTLGGVFQKATFAIFDTKTNFLELKILEMIN